MYIEENLKTEIKDRYDVFVAGGGVAGIAAALSAAREGKKVLICEKSFLLGGLATSGIVTIYLPLCDGMGLQVSFGIAEELLRLSIKDVCEDKYPEAWLENGSFEEKKDRRFEVQFNPYLFAIGCEKLLINEGVRILYGTSVCRTVTENDKIKYLILENKSGRYGIETDSVIDATGDADIAYMSGEETKNFTQGNVLAAWYYSYCKKNGYELNMLGFCDIPDDEKKDKSVSLLSNDRFLGLDGEELSDVTVRSHSSLYNYFAEKRKNLGDYMPVNIATIPQIRMSRGLKGSYIMKTEDEGRFFEDSVGLFSNWKKRGPVYELPWRALHGEKIKNLCACGRCAYAEESMWDVTRVIPVCAVMGEACGKAVSLSDDFTEINIKELQKKLTEKGVKLHITDIED
ncbi:MAG: FAD-dependent oxidoreductase [Armatimonadetes bacterium]|nr:FAD-dependent oxidoreductase [Candidatus Hippobium faecium]